MAWFKIKDSDDTPYYTIPQGLWEKPYDDLTNNDRVVYAALLNRMKLSRQSHWCNKNNEIFIMFSQNQLAEKLKLAVATITRSLKILEQHNLIRRESMGQGKAVKIFVGHVYGESDVPHSETEDHSQNEYTYFDGGPTKNDGGYTKNEYTHTKFDRGYTQNDGGVPSNLVSIKNNSNIDNKEKIDQLKKVEKVVRCDQAASSPVQISINIPTKEDVQQYAISRNSTVLPERFFNYYDTRGWEHVTDWKLKFREWEKNEKTFLTTPKEPRLQVVCNLLKKYQKEVE